MLQVFPCHRSTPAGSRLRGLRVAVLAALLVLASAPRMHEASGSTTGEELSALLSLRDTVHHAVTSEPGRDHFWLRIEGRAYRVTRVTRVSRMRGEELGRLAAVAIESDAVAPGDEASLRESWLRLLRVTGAHYGAATGGPMRFPDTPPDPLRGSVATHVWRVPGASARLETRCVSRTPRGGSTCSALLRVAEAPPGPSR